MRWWAAKGGVSAALVLVAGCGDLTPVREPAFVDEGPPAEAAPAPPVVAVRPPRPTKRLTRAEAERYAVDLVNYDRARQGLLPVRWDAIAARGADRHVRDLASRGFTAHTGSDGSVPEQRYTEAGGVALVMENAACYADAKARDLAGDATFSAASIERIEAAFVDERPPNDGHRRNILGARHTSLGVALAQTKGLDLPCLVHEFVDDYGTYLALPQRARRGASIRIAGELRRPARIAGVGLSRVDLPRPEPPAELVRTGSYASPMPYESFFPRGFKSKTHLDVGPGAHFSVDAPLDRGPGLYSVSVWAQFPGSPDLVMVSLRTVLVE